MGQSEEVKESTQLSLQQQKDNLASQREELKLRKEAFSLIQPFTKALISLGLDPAKILSSPLGAALLMPGRTAIGQEFEAARQQLVDLLGSRGLSTGSGVGAGPLANLFGQEAQQQSQLVAGLPLQALNLGLQGANALTGAGAQLIRPDISGQVALGAGQNVINAPPGFGQQLGLAAVKGGSAALGGLLGNPNLFGGGQQSAGG